MIHQLQSSQSQWSATWRYAVNSFQLVLEYPKSNLSDGQQQVLQNFAKMLELQSMTDVEFVVHGEKIAAHVAVLSSSSPVFLAMFEGQFQEKETKVVDIKDFDVDVIKEMLTFIYTGSAPNLDKETLTEPLFQAADKYQIDTLRRECELSLCANLNTFNIIRRLVLSHLHSVDKLFDSCLQYFVANKTVMWNRPEWKELMKTHPDLFFAASHSMFG